jgi:hypothetical protein
MSSRKEQKEKLRIEREKREAEAKAAERRKQLIGYGAGGALALVAVVVVAVLLLSGGDSEGVRGGGGNVLPEGGSVPEQRITDLAEAAKEGSCERKSFKPKSRDHTTDPAERVRYESNPPTSGRHFENPAPDGAYGGDVPDVKQFVHTLEHGRVIIWFKRSLPSEQRANLRALFEEDEYQMVLVPDDTRMKYAVAATAWNADPTPLGTGRLLGCPRITPAVYDALRSFRDKHRGNGPEPIP